MFFCVRYYPKRVAWPFVAFRPRSHAYPPRPGGYARTRTLVRAGCARHFCSSSTRLQARSHLRSHNSVPDRRAPPPPSEKQSLPSLFAQRKFPFAGVAIAALGLGFYLSLGTASMLGTAGPEPPPCCKQENLEPTGRPPTLTRQTAAEFDRDLNSPEWLMGVTKLRRRLAACARGHVLEVAVGTGRNLAYYDWDDFVDSAQGAEGRVVRRMEKMRGKGEATSPELDSFTGVDISGDMLLVARKKLKKAVPALQGERMISGPAAGGDGGLVMEYNDGRVRLAKSDALGPLPPPQSLTVDRYDIVIQTFGLCSVADPAALVANLARMVRPDTGRILLLEHGRGSWGFVNTRLDRDASQHFERYGCWWNRDLELVVREAAEKVPGLEIVELKRPNWLQFGTLLWVELKVNTADSAAEKSIQNYSIQLSNDNTKRSTHKVVHPQTKPLDTA